MTQKVTQLRQPASKQEVRALLEEVGEALPANTVAGIVIVITKEAVFPVFQGRNYELLWGLEMAKAEFMFGGGDEDG